VTVGAPVAVGGASTKTWTVPITVAGTHDGIVQASIIAGVVNTSLTDSSAASTSTDNQVRYDNIAPTVAINQATGQADPTTVSPIHFTAVFSEAIDPTTFVAGDVTLNAAAIAAGASVTGITPSAGNTTFDVVVGGLTADATVTATIAAGVAADLAGNVNTVSTSTDNSVGFNIPLTVHVGQANGVLDPAIPRSIRPMRRRSTSPRPSASRSIRHLSFPLT